MHKSQSKLIHGLVVFLPLMQASLVKATDLEQWLSSEARADLITAFEDNGCRLTLTEVSDILFDYDASEQHMYTERLILIEPEQSALSFPAVLVKSQMCESMVIEPIKVPSAALAYARNTLTIQGCEMEISVLEALTYPANSVGELTSTDRRNVVSELYNRDEVTFRYHQENGVDKIRVHKLTGTCAGQSDEKE